MAREPDPAASDPAGRVAASIPDGPLRTLIEEVLERNPETAALAASRRAAERTAPQSRAWPEPMLSATRYLEPPETRVGPQRTMVALSQKLPWFGKLGLRGEAAEEEAAAAAARLDAARLRLLTEARRLYHELAFVDANHEVVRNDRATLVRYEELARARYASGVGLEQAVVKLQAEITRAEVRLLDLETQRTNLAAQINGLRDRPAGTLVPPAILAPGRAVRLEIDALRETALAARPEMAEARARVEQGGIAVDLARKQYYPDLTAGLVYTVVAERADMAGRTSPPQDNGSDVFGVSAGINLPIWRAKLAAGVEEARQRQLAAEESRRSVAAQIERTLGDLTNRIPLTWNRLRLFEDVLTVQAEQSLQSAEAAYAAGAINALDLLDAERVDLEVRVAAARARADYAVALAQLEGAVGAPVTRTDAEGEK